MISYKPFWRTMEKKGMTQYRLINYYGVDNQLLCQLRHGGNVTAKTLERLCKILECGVGDIVEFIDD